MPQHKRVTVKYEGRSIQLTLTTCRVFMAGEYAGNVELNIDCDPDLQAVLNQLLRLQNPGESTSESSIAQGGPDEGVSLIFHSDAVARLPEAPEHLSFLWGDETIASIDATLADSVPLEQVHTFIDPLQILGIPAPPTASPVRLGVQRAGLWLLPALLTVGVGAALLLAPDGLMLEDIPHRQAGGSVLMALGVAIAAIGYRLPYRQIWFDLERRQLVILESRSLSPERSLVDAQRIDVDGFSHVRLCERHFAPTLGDDSDADHQEWIVSLEGPIPFAFDGGRVHSRSDAFEVARFSSGRNARRLAAELAYRAGLRILEATGW